MFEKISESVLANNKPLADYLRWAEITPGKRGGSFVGNREVASDELKNWGIVLPKGGMIIPDSSPEELKEVRHQHYEASRLLMENWECLLLDGAKDYCERMLNVAQQVGIQCRLVTKKCDSGDRSGYGVTRLQRYIHLYEGDEHLLGVVSFYGEEGDVNGNFIFEDEGGVISFLQKEAYLRKNPAIRAEAATLVEKRKALVVHFRVFGTGPNPMVSASNGCWVNAPTITLKGDSPTFVTKTHSYKNAHWIVVGGGPWGVYTFSIEDVELAETKLMEMFSMITPSGELRVELKEVQKIFYPQSLGM